MSAPLQRLPECTLAAIVATAVVFALNTAPSGQGLRANTGSSTTLTADVSIPDRSDDPASDEDLAVDLHAGGSPGDTHRSTGSTPDSASLEGTNPEEFGTDLQHQGRPVLSEFRFDDGQLRSRGHSRNGQRFGHWLLYREGDGGLLAEGAYVDDKRSGQWTRYHENGQVESQGEYAEDLREGRWEHFDDRGILIIEEVYTGGLRDGLWRRMYSDGSVREEGHYVRGRREGQWVFRMPDGMLTRQSGLYEHGVKISD